MPEVDDDQLAALRRLRVGFGFVEVVKVVSNDQDDRPGAPDESDQGGARKMEDPRRMSPAEQAEAHAQLVMAVNDSDWQTARQALDDLMRKLLVVHRLLEAEERLAKRKPSAEPT